MLVLAACMAANGEDSPKEYLDEQTAATVLAVGKPLVFSHDRRELAANSRDYVTLVAAAVNRAGKVDVVLIAYFWSTIDQPGKRAAGRAPEQLVLMADDRRLTFVPQSDSPREAGIGSLVHAPPGRLEAPSVYRTDVATLRFLSAARRLTVLSDVNGASAVFDLWDDRRDSLRALVQTLDERK